MVEVPMLVQKTPHPNNDCEGMEDEESGSGDDNND